MKAKLTPEGLVLYLPEKHTTIRLENAQEIKQFLPGIKDSDIQFPSDYPGPEIVHLEVSDRCNLQCPYCYVGKKEAKELKTIEWFKIISRLAKAGVFQVTFGGGEPTMREDLIDLALWAAGNGLNVCMTSNGLSIPKYTKEELQAFNQINISFHLAAGGAVFEAALKHLFDNGIGRGINFCLSRTYEHYLPSVVEIAQKYQAELLVLAYKPVIGDIENQIPPSEVMETVKAIKADNINIYVDGLTCQTCYGSKRFCDIGSHGDVYPCSFIRESQGNILEKSFQEIWQGRMKTVKCPYLKEK